MVPTEERKRQALQSLFLTSSAKIRAVAGHWFVDDQASSKFSPIRQLSIFCFKYFGCNSLVQLEAGVYRGQLIVVELNSYWFGSHLLIYPVQLRWAWGKIIILILNNNMNV